MKKNKTSHLEWIIPVVALIVVTGLWYGSYLFMINKVVSEEKNVSDWTVRGQFGDMFGLINSLFSGLAFAGIIYTIYQQLKEVKKQDMAIESQSNSTALQRFENTLFHLLTTHHDLTNTLQAEYYDDLEAKFRNFQGRKLFTQINSNLKERLKMFDLNVGEYDETTVNTLNNQFNQAIYYHKNELSLYLGSVSTILKFITTSYLLTKDRDQSFYIDIFRNQLSFEERKFLFYYLGIGDPTSEIGGYIFSLRNIETKFKFLKYSKDFLFHNSHFKIQDAYDGFINYHDRN
jgi:hypothetical protein